MNKHPYSILLCSLFVIAFASCKQDLTLLAEPEKHAIDSLILEEPSVPERVVDYDTTLWQEILQGEEGIVLDIRYATENNFTQKQIYDCDRLFLRPALAERLLQLQIDIKKRYGLSLKIFDGYRPKPYQQRLWDAVPDARYVTPPNRGSMHSRGLAVDLTLIDKDGEELDMGTPYDFFGPEAHTDRFNHPKKVLLNRKLLNKLMQLHGLRGIRTEWWHYSLKGERAALSDWVWGCD